MKTIAFIFYLFSPPLPNTVLLLSLHRTYCGTNPKAEMFQVAKNGKNSIANKKRNATFVLQKNTRKANSSIF